MCTTFRSGQRMRRHREPGAETRGPISPASRTPKRRRVIRSAKRVSIAPTRDLAIVVLSLYGQSDHAFATAPLDAAFLSAKQAAAAIWATQTIASTRTLVGQPEVAVRSRDTIGMSEGTVIANEKVGPNNAFKALQTASQLRNVELRDVAADVVAMGVSST